MPPLMYVGAAAVIVVCGVVLYRYRMLRPGGNVVVVRRCGMPDDRGWRHGVIFFDDQEFRYFKLRSLRLTPDRRISRNALEITGRRDLNPQEESLLGEGLRVLLISIDGIDFEVAMGTSCETALTAWVESAPSQRRDFVFRPAAAPTPRRFFR